MSHQISIELFPDRVSHAVVSSSNLNGSGVAIAGARLALAGEEFGRGTRKNVLKTVGKVARAGLGLAKAFGTPEQQAKAGQAEQAYNIVQGAGCTGAIAKKPGTRLRKMMN